MIQINWKASALTLPARVCNEGKPGIDETAVSQLKQDDVGQAEEERGWRQGNGDPDVFPICGHLRFGLPLSDHIGGTQLPIAVGRSIVKSICPASEPSQLPQYSRLPLLET